MSNTVQYYFEKMPTNSIVFNSNSEQFGKIYFENGELHFEGNANKSAESFINFLKEVFKEKMQSDLVSFGNYLLSDARKESIMSNPETSPEAKEEILKQVTDADIANWENLKL